MKLTLILAAAIIAVGMHRWLNRATTYHTPAAVYPLIYDHARNLLFGQYRTN